MDRQFGRWTGVVVLLGLVATAAAGCNAVATAWWVFKDGKTALAECGELNNKTVAVICRGPQDIRFRHEQQAPQRLASRVAYLLQGNLKKKTKLIDQEKINKLTDEQEIEDVRKLGKELNADMVVFVDLQSFSYQRGRSIHQGRAELEVNVHDLSKDGPPIYTKRMNNIIFPPMIEGVPATEMSEREFMDRFINYLARHIGQKFYDFDPRADFATYMEE